MPREDVENDPQTETPDFLIEQSRRLFEVYGARQSTAETKIAGAVTAAVALATITVTGTTAAAHVDGAHVNECLASIVVGCLVLCVLVAFFARSGGGLQHRKSWFSLSSESEEFREARRALGKCGINESPTRVKKLALEMWRARERDTRRAARAKEWGAAMAGALLGVALICDGILGYMLITGTG
jgi:hypothetical protein